MRDIDDLRHALDAETANLTVHIPVRVIRRRARGVRIRQTATLTVAAAIVVAVGALPVVMIAGGSSPGSDAAAQVSGASACPPLFSTDPPGTAALGPLVETGATLDAPNLDARYDVLIGLVGTRDQPGFIVAFRDRHTRVVQRSGITLFERASNGDFAGKQAGDPAHQFYSSQLALGPNKVLDVGLYSRPAHRITVTSEGHATDAETTQNTATGWTFFWVQRSAKPLPPDRFTTSGEYQGPEKLTVAAYDAVGRPQPSDGHVGASVQNPRDNSLPEKVTPSPTCGSALPTGVVPT